MADEKKTETETEVKATPSKTTPRKGAAQGDARKTAEENAKAVKEAEEKRAEEDRRARFAADLASTGASAAVVASQERVEDAKAAVARAERDVKAAEATEKAALEAERAAGPGGLAPASESGDPVIHKILAEQDIARQNGDQDRVDECTERLANLGYAG